MSEGARLILNARYFHIAKGGERASKKAFLKNAAAGLIKYIATRESVIFNMSNEEKQAPASLKQQTAIESFLSSAPELKNSAEYREYTERGSAYSASSFISHAMDYVFGLDKNGMLDSSRPATEAQIQAVEEFIQRAPKLKATEEYKDYEKDKSFENASEFLSHSYEEALLQGDVDPETMKIMLNYISERPGVVKNEISEHGLFSGGGAANLEEEKQRITQVKGNVFSLVLSLRREDANALGFDKQDAWKKLIESKLDMLAKEFHVSLNEMHWIGAVHNTKHHPHMHLIIYSDDPKTRLYLSKGAIRNVKSSLMSTIFEVERETVFAPRAEVKKRLQTVIKELVTQAQSNASEELRARNIPKQLKELREDILQAKGRHVYKYLPPNAKGKVNALLDELGELPGVKALLIQYHEYQAKLESYYKTTPYIPRRLSEMPENSDLYGLKNVLVKAALDAAPSTDEQEPDAQKITEQQARAQEIRDINAAYGVLSFLAQTLGQSTLDASKDVQRADRRVRRQARDKKHALGQKEDWEQSY